MDTAAPGCADLDIPMDMIGGKADDITAAHSESFALDPLDASMMQGILFSNF